MESNTDNKHNNAENNYDNESSLEDDSLDDEEESRGYFNRSGLTYASEMTGANANSMDNTLNNLNQSSNTNYFETSDNKEDQLFGEEEVKETNPETDMINHKNFYKNAQRDPGIEGRKASRILFLRSFNNWVKAALINKYCYALGRDLSVMDICCGRGGDLEKYFRNQLKVYVGADLSDESLRNAMDRIAKLKSEKFRTLLTKCFFITEDVSDPDNNLLKKIPSPIYFDLVSCQFAMHYHFESEIKVRTFLENVTSKLNTGGYFIGTIIDSNTIVKRLRNRKYKNNKYLNEKFTFGNEFYSVKFYQKRFPKTNGPYGIKYGFYLEDSIDKREMGKIKYVGEYLVMFENFVNLCKEYDLHLVERKNFTEFYEDSMENKYYRDLFRKMIKEIEVPTKEMQWEIIQLYQVFAFRKGKEKEEKGDKGERKDRGKKHYRTHYTPVFKNSKIQFKDYNPEFIEDKFE